MLKSRSALEKGYAALQAAKSSLQADGDLSPLSSGASYADAKPNGEANSDAADVAYINHGGQTIRATSADYAVGAKIFASL